MEPGRSLLSQMWEEVALLTPAVAAGSAWAVRGRSSQVFGRSVWQGNTAHARVALTFDDGPSSWTQAILDSLAEHGAKATFFQVGAIALRHPIEAKQVSENGHEIGNHTQTHARLYLRSPSFVKNEIRLAQNSLTQIHGVRPRWFRATYGCRWFGVNSAQRENGLTGAMWTVIALDWKLDEDAIVNRLLAGARNGAIFCLHDGRAQQKQPDARNTAGAVRKLLPELRRRGYEIVTLSEITK